MSYDFNADDVLAMAEQMEINGGKFYRTAAESTSEPANKEFLLELALMEDQHEKTFKNMRAELSEKEKELAVDLQAKQRELNKRRSQAAVVKSFEIDDATLKHPTRKTLKPKKIHHVLPHVQQWGKAFTLNVMLWLLTYFRSAMSE